MNNLISQGRIDTLSSSFQMVGQTPHFIGQDTVDTLISYGRQKLLFEIQNKQATSYRNHEAFLDQASVQTCYFNCQAEHGRAMCTGTVGGGEGQTYFCKLLYSRSCAKCAPNEHLNIQQIFSEIIIRKILYSTKQSQLFV